MVYCAIVNALRLCPANAGAESLGAVDVERVTALYVAHLADNSRVPFASGRAVLVNQMHRDNAVNLLFYVVITFHRLFVVPWGGLNIVRCYSLDCLNVLGRLLVADAEMRLCAASRVLALTAFADVHTAPIKPVNAAE